MSLCRSLIAVLLLGALSGCQTLQPAQEAPPAKLSWESAKAENKAWSEFVFALLRQGLLASFDQAQDVSLFCPKYRTLREEEKVAVFGELISAVAKFESSWNPASVYHEPAPLNYDSIGLLQLSYEDHRGYSFCPAAGTRDLKDPRVNLDCGMRILARQVERRGKLILSSDVYWSVLKDGGAHSKIPQIRAMVAKLPFCS